MTPNEEMPLSEVLAFLTERERLAFDRLHGSAFTNTGSLEALMLLGRSLAGLRRDVHEAADGLDDGWSHTDVASWVLQLADGLPRPK